MLISNDNNNTDSFSCSEKLNCTLFVSCENKLFILNTDAKQIAQNYL